MAIALVSVMDTQANVGQLEPFSWELGNQTLGHPAVGGVRVIGTGLQDWTSVLVIYCCMTTPPS